MIVRYALVCLALPALFLTTGAYAGPQISFTETGRDLGKVYYGTKKSTEFTFKNTGDQTLIIKKLRSSCGCTQAVEGDKEIPPGGSSKITATFDSTGYKAGKLKKTIYVHTNNREEPISKVVLYANIVRRVKATPTSFTLKLHGFQSEIPLKMKMYNTTDKPIRIEKVIVSGSAVAARPDPENIVVNPDGKTSFTIRLQLSKEEKWPFHMGKIKLMINDPVEKNVTISYFIKVKSSLDK